MAAKKHTGPSAVRKLTRRDVRDRAIAKLNERLEAAGVHATWTKGFSEQLAPPDTRQSRDEREVYRALVASLRAAKDVAERVADAPCGIWAAATRDFFRAIEHDERGRARLKLTIDGPLTEAALRRGPDDQPPRARLVAYWQGVGVPWRESFKPTTGDLALISLATIALDARDGPSVNATDAFEDVFERERDAVKKCLRAARGGTQTGK